LGKALKDKRYLEVLALKRNDIGINGIRDLESVLVNSKTIRELDLAGNQIGDEGAQIVTDALKSKQKQQLTLLNLADNRITSKGCNMVVDLLSKCRTLDELQL